MTGASPFTFVLSGDVTVKSAQAVSTALREALDAHPIVQVDTQTVAAADVTTVQTLLAGLAKAQAEGRTLSMLAPLGQPLRNVLAAGSFMEPAPGAGFWNTQTLQTSGTSAA
ncbi:STAS domain-containing protein [Devosia sp. SD17-2]|uniref:STAS domain-containing protein n=1 Tax=Devosia sp. SD17-2 TaxID=2976459 RepID=UPI0023D8982F|nr:STAS domain-containing protein [Devosia sp. SD17-2]WEJ33101.1 STAS domain-containing protein [Devosia sp. SD17-2]